MQFERALGVLDGAVLVLSTVEGVQPQTVMIWRALRRLGVPILLYVNKADPAGADPARVLSELRRRLAPYAVSLSRVDGAGTAEVWVRPRPPEDAAVVEGMAERDDRLLDLWAAGRRIPRPLAVRALRGLVASARLSPVLAGSAVTGAGVPELTVAITAYLPRAGDRPGAGNRPGEPSGVVTGLVSARIGDTFGPRPQRAAREHHFPPATLEAVVDPVRDGQRGALFDALTELAERDPLIALRSEDARREIVVSLYGEVQKEVLAALLAEEHKAMSSVGADFRGLTPVVLMAALQRAGTVVCERCTGSSWRCPPTR